MLLSLAFILLFGLVLGYVFEKLKLPRLLGMLLAGILIGPYTFNLLDKAILSISSELRQIALIIILARAGLNLDFRDLKQVGRPAILLCFVPACFEIVGTLLLAPTLLGLTLLESAILGTVLAAVSPAVVVPRMLYLMNNGYGKQHSVPQMIMAGASVDDVFVIVLFSAFTRLAQTGNITPAYLLAIPTSILFGLLAGYLVGQIIAKIFEKIHLRDSIKICMILSFAFIFVSIEQGMHGNIGFSGLLAVMAMGAAIRYKRPVVSIRLAEKFSKLWVGAEVLLFVLVGASVNIRYAVTAGYAAVVLIIGILLFRTVGVFVSVIKTKLNYKERMFTAISYLPKATVQAAIGGIPLAMGLACGETVLAIAVLSIIITAPLGAILIDTLYQRLLSK